jgi:CubicO group peptidase (beta-lactamase class C family)
MRAHHVPGVSISIIDSERVVWAGGFGLEETRTTDSVTTTLFQAQSISKPVATTAMLHLVEEGRLTLDEHGNANT